MALIPNKKVLGLNRINVLPPNEREVSEDRWMTYEAPGRPARSIQLDSPFIEEDSLQPTLSRSSGSSIVADLSYDLDKFSPSYQPFQFDYSSRTLPRPGLDSLEVVPSSKIGVDFGEERSLIRPVNANDIRDALHERFLELGEAIKRNEQMYEEMERQLVNPDALNPRNIRAALSEVASMLLENEQIQQAGEDFKEEIDEIMKKMSYELLAAVLNYSEQEGITLGHKIPYNELVSEYKKLSEEFNEAKKKVETLEPRLQDLQTEKQRLENSVMEKDDMISEYNTSIARLKTDKGVLELQIQNNRMRYQELENLTKEQEAELGRVRAGVISLEEANKYLTEENTELKESFSQDAATTEALERSEKRYRALEKILRDCQAEIVALRQRIALLDPNSAERPLPPTTALKFTFNPASLVTTSITLTDSTNPHSLFHNGSRWIDIAPDDLDFRSGTHTVQRDHRNNPPPAHSIKRVIFSAPFTEEPTVVVWLTAAQMSLDRRWRLKTFATSITNEGFDLHVESWADSYLVSAGASWVAYLKEGVITGEFKAAEKGGWKIAMGEKFGVVRWPGRFAEEPMVLLGVGKIECDVEAEIGVMVGGKAGKEDMQWIVTAKPEGGRVFTVGGVYLAMEVE